MPQPFLIPGRCLEVPEIQRELGERFQSFSLAVPSMPQCFLIPGQGLNTRRDFNNRGASRAPRGVIGAGELIEKGFDIAAWHGRELRRNNLETRRNRNRSRHDPRSSHAAIISARSDMPNQGSPEVFVSFAWGDKTLDASQEGPPAQEIVERGTALLVRLYCEARVEKRQRNSR
jgi:hypothetical protein